MFKKLACASISCASIHKTVKRVIKFNPKQIIQLDIENENTYTAFPTPDAVPVWPGSSVGRAAD